MSTWFDSVNWSRVDRIQLNHAMAKRLMAAIVQKGGRRQLRLEVDPETPDDVMYLLDRDGRVIEVCRWVESFQREGLPWRSGMSIIVDGSVIRTYPKSNATSEQDRREENLWAAMQALEAARTSPFPAVHDNWQAWMMACLKPIAAHFEVDADAVLALWAGHYGVGLAVQGEPP